MMLIDVVMPMYNSLEYSNNYPKIFGILWKIYRDVPAVINNNEIFDFHASNSDTRSFNLKFKLFGRTATMQQKCWNNDTIKIFK